MRLKGVRGVLSRPPARHRGYPFCARARCTRHPCAARVPATCLSERCHRTSPARERSGRASDRNRANHRNCPCGERRTEDWSTEDYCGPEFRQPRHSGAPMRCPTSRYFSMTLPRSRRKRSLSILSCVSRSHKRQPSGVNSSPSSSGPLGSSSACPNSSL